MSTEVLDDNKNVNSPHSARLSGELKAIVSDRTKAERAPQLHASDSVIDSVILAARNSEGKRFVAGLGAYLSLFQDAQSRLPFEIDDPKKSRAKLQEKVSHYGTQWRQTLKQSGKSEQIVTDTLANLNETISRVKKLKSNGDVSTESAQAFLEMMANGLGVKEGQYLSPYYGIYINIEDFDDQLKKVGSSKHDKEIIKKRQVVNEKFGTNYGPGRSTDFVHVNQPEIVNATDRIYIALNPFGNPSKGLQAWWQVLEETGLNRTLYYKFSPAGTNRADSIVVYPTADTDSQKLQTALTRFQELTTSAELLPHSTKTGVELARGMSYGIEDKRLVNIHRLLDEDNERVSFGRLLSVFTELSMRLAYRKSYYEDPHGNGQVKLSDIEGYAKQYLKELLICAGINPDTMVPWNRGGQLPQWAQAMRNQLTV